MGHGADSGSEAARRNPREVLTRPAPGPRFTVAYGSHPDQIADVWLPESTTQRAAGRTTQPTAGRAAESAAGQATERTTERTADTTRGPALVVFVHGGFWRAAFDRTHVRPLANDLAAHGYAVATIEYRRVGQQGGGWPGSFDDVALAFDTVPTLAAEAAGVAWGGVVLAGHSAGGHLALWGAVRHRLPDSASWRRAGAPPVAGVLALAPVADLADAYRRRLGDGAAGDLLGGGPDEFPARYAAVDPATLPVPEVPTVLVHGALDDRVPVEQSRRYAQRGARLVELPDVEHFAVIDPVSDAWPAVREALAGLSPG